MVVREPLADLKRLHSRLEELSNLLGGAKVTLQTGGTENLVTLCEVAEERLQLLLAELERRGSGVKCA